MKSGSRRVERTRRDEAKHFKYECRKVDLAQLSRRFTFCRASVFTGPGLAWTGGQKLRNPQVAKEAPEVLQQLPLRLEELVEPRESPPWLHELALPCWERWPHEEGRRTLRPELRLRSPLESAVVEQRHREADKQLGKDRSVPLLRSAPRETELEESSQLSVELEPRPPLVLVEP